MVTFMNIFEHDNRNNRKLQLFVFEATVCNYPKSRIFDFNCTQDFFYVFFSPLKFHAMILSRHYKVSFLLEVAMCVISRI